MGHHKREPQAPTVMSIPLSVVIPTLDAAAVLPATLAALAEATDAGLALEVIVADGGSGDGTLGLAREAGLRLIEAGPGRGRQLAAGAAAARADWLLFLHADTVPAPGWARALAAHMARPENLRRAAVFRFALDDPGTGARRLEAFVAWRCRLLALPYGDQGLLISRVLYDELEGFRPLPLMEDVDLVRRIGRRRLVLLDQPAATSAARYRRGGYLGRPLRNLACLALYWLGAPIGWVARLYG